MLHKASKVAILAAVIVADVIAMLETPASASSLYTFSTFVVPGYADGGTFLSGVNDRGQVVGGYGFDIENFGSQAFVATNGNINTINVPGFFVNDALGINNMGQIVGSYLESSPGNIAWQGFIDNNGSFTSVNVPGADATQVFGINNRGQVVGASSDYSINKSIGFIYTKGHFTPINVPEAYATVPLDINDRGQVVGLYQEVELGPGSGFLDSNGHFTSISVPGSIYTVPKGINDRGQVVGYYLDDNSVQHGFVDYNGIITTFNVQNTDGTAGFGINDRGQIVGGYIVGGIEYGFVGTSATPSIPEPSTWAMMLLGFAGLGYVGFRKARARSAISDRLIAALLFNPHYARRVDECGLNG